jgi:hypothetical protein
MNTPQEFIAWESSTRDTIDFKKCYVDAAGGDLVAGLLLSQVVYWHLPVARTQESRLRITKDGVKWLAKERADWWDECRITPKQFDRACAVLEQRGLILSVVMKYNNCPTKHVRIDWEVFIPEVKAAILAENTRQEEKEGGILKSPKGEFRNLPLGNLEINERGTSRVRVDAGASSETTSEITTETTHKESALQVQCAFVEEFALEQEKKPRTKPQASRPVSNPSTATPTTAAPEPNASALFIDAFQAKVGRPPELTGKDHAALKRRRAECPGSYDKLVRGYFQSWFGDHNGYDAGTFTTKSPEMWLKALDSPYVSPTTPAPAPAVISPDKIYVPPVSKFFQNRPTLGQLFIESQMRGRAAEALAAQSNADAAAMQIRDSH